MKEQMSAATGRAMNAPHRPEQRTAGQGGTEGNGSVQLHRLGADLRAEPVVLDLLVDQHVAQHDQRGDEPWIASVSAIGIAPPM